MSSRPAFNGFGLVIVRGLPDTKGTINVKAISTDLQSASTQIKLQ